MDDGTCMIDYLRIGGEEMTYDILNGGTNALQNHVKHLEFEYNWKGAKQDHALSDALQRLCLLLGGSPWLHTFSA